MINQIIVFIVPLHLGTAGDVTNTVALLTTGLTLGESTSPALFRIFIDDLVKELRTALGQDAEGGEDCLRDPAKLVADDVILLAEKEDSLQILLDACTAWTKRNTLDWKPQKCSVVIWNQPDTEDRLITLEGQEIPQITEARYLGMTVIPNGFMKNVDAQLEKICFDAYVAVIRQPFFDAKNPNSTFRALYRTNIRSILMYGLMLTTDINVIERLDRRLINCFFEPILQQKRELSARLADRFCLKIRLPSLKMDLECGVKNWISRLRWSVHNGLNTKVRRHAKDTLYAIQKMDENTILRKQYTGRGEMKEKAILNAFEKWHVELAPAKRSSRAVDKVSKLVIARSMLDSHNFQAPLKYSAYRYLVYRFPTHAKLNGQEQRSLRLLLKQDLNNK